MVLQVADDWFCKMLSHATVAGACSAMARQEPGAARGLMRAADKHRAAATALMLEKMASARSPTWG